MTPKPAAHTPTPWKVVQATEILSEDDRHIASFDHTDKILYSECIANAAFIVRSTNNFENMLAALKYVVESGESYECVQEIVQHAIDEATK